VIKSFPGFVRIEEDEASRPPTPTRWETRVGDPGPALSLVEGPRPVALPAPAPEAPEDLEEARRRKREQKRVEDATRPLESWERYRALNDAIDEAYELIDIANREARFALIIMGALNAALFVIGGRSDISGTMSGSAGPWMIAAFVAYAAASLYFLLAAIDTLRPRTAAPLGPRSAHVDPDRQPLGIRYYQDVVLRDASSHCDAWREVRIGQLNAELALHVYGLSGNNKAKQAALRRLYGGLQILTVTVAGLLLLFGVVSL